MQQSKVDLNRIQTFITLVESQSFTKAAQVLKQPKSRVSRHISNLEKELNTQLIYRTTRQFQLTEAGKQFYESCRVHLLEIKDSISKLTDAAEQISGTIRLTAPDDLSISLLSKVCSEFMLRYPKIKLDLVITNSVVDMVKQGIDLAIRVGQPKATTFLSRRLGKITSALVASPDYLRRFDNTPEQDNIQKFTCLTSYYGPATDVWKLVDESGQKKNFKFDPAVICSNHHMLRNLVLDGRGISFLPYFIVEDDIRSGRLVDIHPNYRAEVTSIYLLMPPQKKTSLKLRKMIDLIVEGMQGHLQ